MITVLKKMFGLGESDEIAHLIKNGAVILDVRSKAEYLEGHVKGALNIPIGMLENYVNNLSKDTPIVIICNTGDRSSAARRLLLSHGFTLVYNGGSWKNLSV